VYSLAGAIDQSQEWGADKIQGSRNFTLAVLQYSPALNTIGAFEKKIGYAQTRIDHRRQHPTTHR
jgi:hypothetical protein